VNWRTNHWLRCFHRSPTKCPLWCSIQVFTLHNGVKQGIYRQIFSRKSISRKIRILSPFTNRCKMQWCFHWSPQHLAPEFSRVIGSSDRCERQRRAVWILQLHRLLKIGDTHVGWPKHCEMFLRPSFVNFNSMGLWTVNCWPVLSNASDGWYREGWDSFPIGCTIWAVKSYNI